MTRPRLVLDDPQAFLNWLAAVRERGRASFDEVELAQVFAIAAVAALAHREGTKALELDPAASTGAGRFAHAIGLDEEVLGGQERAPTERDRTVTLTRVKGRGPKEAISAKIVNLLLPGPP